MTATELETELTDPELISCVRDGDVTAYGTLFSRHVDAATRLAKMLVPGPDADDLVSEAFVKVLNVLLGGGGPDVAFRAYLLTAVRRLHVDKVRGTQRATPTGDLTPYDPGVPFTDTAVAGFEGGAAAKAFASLPERWQLVLWHLEVENQKPADIAPLLGMSANSVSALAYRAREGLRQAFLNMHSGDLVDERCRVTHELLGGYVRGALARRHATKVEDHLDHCRRCTATYLELTEVNTSLGALLGPALLGTAAAAYLGAGGATVGGATGLLALLDRGKDVVLANSAVAAGTAGVVGVAAVAAVVVGTHHGQPGPADRPAVAAIAPSLTGSDSSTARTGAGSQRLAIPGRPGAAGTNGALTTPAPGGPASAAVVPAPGGGSAQTGTSVGQQTQNPPQTQNPGGTSSGPSGSTHPPSTAPQPSPHPQPSPKPRPTPTPTPTPTPDPPSSPPPPPPPAHVADLSVSAGTSDSGGWFQTSITVHGVPDGTTATLSITVDRGQLRLAGPGCSPAGRGFVCQASAAHSTFTFVVPDNARPRISYRVDVPAGWTDPVPGNNAGSVQATGHGNDHGPGPGPGPHGGQGHGGG